jgi:ribonuclease H2 subunit C
MFAIQTKSAAPQLVPNLLPCSIKHSGPVNISQQHWDPQSHTKTTGNVAEVSEDQTDEAAYFRGRKLLGKPVALPANYTGLVLEKSDEHLEQKPTELATSGNEQASGLDDAETLVDEVRLMKATAQFDRIVVWGHEELSQDDDTYVKGISEWMQFAQAVGGSPMLCKFLR